MFLGLLILYLCLHTGLRKLTAAGLAAFCGGALSNLLDRVAHGTVVDFLNLAGGGFHSYIFNLADVAIGAGLAIAGLGVFFHVMRFVGVNPGPGARG
ncbi:MAG: signal peptidase II [Desulfobacteraceae bacterium]|nr:signal peptidase II [Desulfobacteraceae bacterium]